MEDLVGKSTGRYRILEKLGEGGMAVVYKAYDTRLEVEVAFKVLRMELVSAENKERSFKRFKIEAQKTARLDHPNIIPVIDFGEFEGIPFLVMQYIKGKSLKAFCQTPMLYSDAAKIVFPIAQALAKAHKSHIIHRDVKPSNIMIAEDGTPFLTDFGIAKVLDEEETVDGLSIGGMVIGTPEYMAPEQWEGSVVDGRADVYALGVVFYELITGRPPFKADTIPATMAQVLRDPLPKASQFEPGIPFQVDQVLGKALARRPENRFQTILEFADCLETISNTSIDQINITVDFEETSQFHSDDEDVVVKQIDFSALKNRSIDRRQLRFRKLKRGAFYLSFLLLLIATVILWKYGRFRSKTMLEISPTSSLLTSTSIALPFEEVPTIPFQTQTPPGIGSTNTPFVINKPDLTIMSVFGTTENDVLLEGEQSKACITIKNEGTAYSSTTKVDLFYAKWKFEYPIDPLAPGSSITFCSNYDANNQPHYACHFVGKVDASNLVDEIHENNNTYGTTCPY